MDPIQPYNADANGNPIDNLYGFPDSNSNVITRLRRVERTVPYLVRGSSVLTTAKAQGIDPSALTANNEVDLASSLISKVGSVPPAGVVGQFAAVTTTTTITWYWDGTNGSTPLVICRADGTFLSVPRGTLAVSGLTLNTTYYFLPFWSINLGCNGVGWVIGTVGSPKIAFTLANTTDPANAQYYLTQQSLQNREPLANGFMTQATTAAGTGGGGAGGGGIGGSCVMSGTDIEPIGDYGQMSEGVHHHFHWVRLATENKKVLQGTLDHPIYICRDDERNEVESIIAEHGYKEELLEPYRCQMQDAEVGYLVITNEGLSAVAENHKFNRNCTKRSVHMDRGHLFWANGVLSHNLKPVSG